VRVKGERCREEKGGQGRGESESKGREMQRRGDGG
jgi:hypothetical protein